MGQTPGPVGTIERDGGQGAGLQRTDNLFVGFNKTGIGILVRPIVGWSLAILAANSGRKATFEIARCFIAIAVLKKGSLSVR